jgi:hypothetical protein
MPTIPFPRPQDFIIGKGKKPCLLYDDLVMFQWVQGCLSMAKHESDISTVWAMLAQLR